MSNPVPGWYPDSVTPGQQRYWDGAQWTEHVAPLPQTTQPPTAQPQQPAPYYGYAAPQYTQPPTSGTLAHWGLRVASYLLDTLIAAPFFFIAGVIEGTHENPDGFHVFITSAPTVTGGSLIAYWIFYFAGVAVALWNVAYRQGTTGYSVGKQVVGIKLIREYDGQVLGGWPAFGRNFLHILDFISFGIGFLWPLWDAKKQTFADKCVHTVVIVQPRPKA